MLTTAHAQVRLGSMDVCLGNAESKHVELEHLQIMTDGKGDAATWISKRDICTFGGF